MRKARESWKISGKGYALSTEEEKKEKKKKREEMRFRKMDD